ncbi:hypothetical protein C8Q74DRAFT_1249937 [Fomes fomentarius]|nr:hypothetical protein C8Q74DRAFT_1249937 [Fomes fomentarius]
MLAKLEQVSSLLPGFLARIPGSAPQYRQCEAFEHPDLTHAKTTSSVYSQFALTSASVLESIGANHLQCVDTAVLADHHGSRACDSQDDYAEVSEYINYTLFILRPWRF